MLNIRESILFEFIAFPFNAMGWTPEDQAFFVGLNLGPTLAAKGFGDIKIMIMDDQRILLPKWVKTVRTRVSLCLISPN